MGHLAGEALLGETAKNSPSRTGISQKGSIICRPRSCSSRVKATVVSKVTQNKKRRGMEGRCGHRPKPGCDTHGDRRFYRGTDARALSHTWGPQPRSVNAHSWRPCRVEAAGPVCPRRVAGLSSCQGPRAQPNHVSQRYTHSLLQGWGRLDMDPTGLQSLSGSVV